MLASVAGEEWKLDAYRRYDATNDPRDEPYCVTACKIFGVPDGSYTKDSPRSAMSARPATSRLAIRAAWAPGVIFEPDRFSDDEVETFKSEWRATHPKIVQFWYDIDRAAVKAVHERGVDH